MKAAWFVLFGVTLLGARVAHSQDGTAAREPAAQPPAAPAPAQAQPASAAPTDVPPPPPAEPPPLKVKGKKKAAKQQAAPPDEEDQVVYSLGSVTVAIPTPTQQPTRIGQWVFTTQHGWLYMPYGEQYVSAGSGEDANAYGYAYSPDGGWRWVDAPWVSGWGPNPYYGTLGSHSYLWANSSYGRYYSVGLRPSRYDLNYNYYGAPMPGPQANPGYRANRVGRQSNLVGGPPVYATPSPFPRQRSDAHTGRSPAGGGTSSFTGSTGSGLAGFRAGSSTLRGGPVLGGSRGGSSTLGGGSMLGSSHGGASSSGGGSALRSSSGVSGGGHGSMGNSRGGSFSGHGSGSASVGYRR